MNIKERIKTHPYFYLAILLVVVGGTWYWYSHRTATGVTQYVIGTATKQTIISYVNGTGQVGVLKKIDLKPQGSGVLTNNGSGLLTSMVVAVSQKVKAGDLIATIDQTTASASYEQARASLVSAQANYDKLINGATQTDLDSAQQDVSTAELALQNAKNNLDAVIQQQNTAVANAWRTLLTSGIGVTQALWSSASPNVVASDLPTITGSYSLTSTGTLHIFQQGPYFSASGIQDIPMQKIDTRIPATVGTTGLYLQFPNDQISSEWDINIPNPQASSYVANLSSYQAALLTQKQSLSTAQNQVVSAETSLKKAQNTLTKLVLPPDASSLASARAQLINAQSQLRTASSNYNATRIVAPFDGVIAATNAQKGDQVTAATIIATLITEQKVVTVSLNEVDAAKVKVGDPTTLTFDAVPDLSLTGKVSQIDVIGTVSQGVVNYNVQIVFDTQDERVHPSMSASAAIITATASDVLAVPNSAVKTSNGQSYVQVVDKAIISTQNGNTVTLSATPATQDVQVGLVSDSATEIVSGLQEGTMVVSRTINATAAPAASSASAVRIPGLTGGGGGGGGGFRTGN